MKKILITNDDGIHSNGLLRLARVASKFGEVYVVAPKTERSAMSHKIIIREPIYLEKEVLDADIKCAYSITGTPADCIRIGVGNIIKEKPDLVFSGINNGFNLGKDTQYSATLGAAFEASSMGIRSFAFSEGIDGSREVTDKYIEQIIEDYIDEKLEYNQVLNINFPECKLCEFKGVLTDRTVAKRSYFCDIYHETKEADGRIRFDVEGLKNTEDADPGTDFKAVLDNYISIGKINNHK